MHKHPEPLQTRLSAKPACPHCQGDVKRVPRKLFDRLRGLLRPRRHTIFRYHCVAPACAWDGTLERLVRGRNLYGSGGARRHVLDAARMLSSTG